MDRLRAEIAVAKRETQNEVLVRNSELHQQQKRLEILRSDRFRSDIEREKMERFVKDRSRESGQVRRRSLQVMRRLRVAVLIPSPRSYFSGADVHQKFIHALPRNTAREGHGD